MRGCEGELLGRRIARTGRVEHLAGGHPEIAVSVQVEVPAIGAGEDIGVTGRELPKQGGGGGERLNLTFLHH